jgi:hypothetical protein
MRSDATSEARMSGEAPQAYAAGGGAEPAAKPREARLEEGGSAGLCLWRGC